MIIPGGYWVALFGNRAKRPVVCWKLHDSGSIYPMVWSEEKKRVVYAGNMDDFEGVENADFYEANFSYGFISMTGEED